MWPAIISAGASLIGGALSRKTAKKERASHFVNLRASAEAGGFNPLTVLRATQGGGYGNYSAALSRSPFENALNDGAQAFQQYSRDTRTMAHETNLQTMRQSHEMKLSRAQNAAFGSANPEGGTSIKAFGVDSVANENFSDVELAEQRYGDIVSIPIGLSVAAGDIYSTGKTAIANSALGQELLTRATNKAAGWTKDPVTGVPQMPGFTWKNLMPDGWNLGRSEPLRIEINRSHVPNPRRPN